MAEQAKCPKCGESVSLPSSHGGVFRVYTCPECGAVADYPILGEPTAQEKCPVCGLAFEPCEPDELPADIRERMDHPDGAGCLRRQLAAKDAEIAKAYQMGRDDECREWCQVIEDILNFHPISQREAQQGGIKRIKAKDAEIGKLRETVDKLPKTADGVSVAGGDRVYRPDDPRCYYVCGAQAVDGFAAFRIDTCYSTRKAAEAAKETP